MIYFHHLIPQFTGMFKIIHYVHNIYYVYERAFLVVQSVKNLPATQEIQDRFLGQEIALEKEMAIHSSILA